MSGFARANREEGFVVVKNNRKKDPLLSAQETMTQMLVEIDRICVKHNISYWLSAGTLLGAVRHQAFIPWDDDADINMMREDYERFLKVINEELSQPYKVQSEKYNTHGLHNWCKIVYLDDYEWVDWHGNWTIGLSVDIFPFDYVDDRERLSSSQKVIHRIARIREPLRVTGIKTLLQKSINRLQLHKLAKKIYSRTNTVTYGIETDYYGWTYFKKDDIFPLSKGSFEGYQLSIPNNAHECLTREYGDYMQIPEEDERIQHMKELRFKI